LACGLKRGFSFFHHTPEDKEPPWTDRGRQLLVAASPHDGIADTHWYRKDFDFYLVRKAQRAGVEYLDKAHLDRCSLSEKGVCLHGTRAGCEVTIKARFVIDATGPRGFLYRALNLGERELPGHPATQAIYNHFLGVKRINDLSQSNFWSHAPYPVDDAAVHHIFDGGWMWVLRFNNGITSAGVSVTDRMAAELDLSGGEPAWLNLLQRVPTLAEQFSDAKPLQPFRHIPRLGFRSAAIAGRNWALLPSAAGFVDPLLSTGFPLTLLGVTRLASIMEQDWETDGFSERLRTYALQTDNDLLAAARLIRALYASMSDFPLFRAITLLYFAAASYSETARRLGRPQIASSFLLHDDPRFGPDCRLLLERVSHPHLRAKTQVLIQELLQIIQPIDVAGLGRLERGNWYPVDARDLLKSSHKLNASHDEVVQMLERCGFDPVTFRSSAQT
jgi:FADH2 O2-dependent halogenase